MKAKLATVDFRGGLAYFSSCESQEEKYERRPLIHYSLFDGGTNNSRHLPSEKSGIEGDEQVVMVKSLTLKSSQFKMYALIKHVDDKSALQ